MNQLMNLGKVASTVLLLNVVVTCAYAQSFRSIIEKLRKDYENVTTLHMVIDMKVFEDSASSMPFYSDKIELRRDGDNFRSMMGSQELLLNSRYMVIVNKASREITYTARDIKSESKVRGQLPISLDSLFSVLGEPEFKGKDRDVSHYTLRNKAGEISMVDFYIDENKGHMKKMVYRYAAGHIVTISFDVFDLQPKFDEQTFSEGRYLTFNNGVATASASFGKFVILNSNQ